MTTDDEVRGLAAACLLPALVGPHPPTWILDALADGVGGVVLFGSNLGDGSDVRRLTDTLREAAGRDVVIALDEEGGDVTRLDTVRGSASPGAAALGALDDLVATEEVYAAIGARLVDAGITLDLAPVADVNLDPRNPVIGVRSFSADPHVAARHVAAAVRGIQRAGVAACAKHFPGHGATSADSHHEVATVDRSRAQLAADLLPFRDAIAAGVRSIMTGHLLVPALDPDRIATVSAPITTALLRDELGFAGTVVTDALEMRAVSATIGILEGFVSALIAGADTIELGAQEYPEFVGQIPYAVLRAVHDGRLGIERLADAAERTALLAAPGHAAAFDAETADDAARRSVEVAGRLPRLQRPLVVECRTPNGVATGTLPWSLADRLRPLVAGAEVLVLSGPDAVADIAARAHGRSLVAVVRDPGRHPWQADLLAVAEAHPDAVVVDLGWPGESEDRFTGRVPRVRTRGIAPGLLEAAAHTLAQA